MRDLEVLTTGAYIARLNDPTPWSRKMMPHHRNMVRSLCEVRQGWGGGVPHVLGTVRFSGKAPALPRAKGLSSAHLLEARALPPTTAEQKIRGGDAGIESVLLVGGYDEDAVETAALGGTVDLFRPAFSLSPGETG